jgi:hypothetical protein
VLLPRLILLLSTTQEIPNSFFSPTGHGLVYLTNPILKIINDKVAIAATIIRFRFDRVTTGKVF